MADLFGDGLPVDHAAQLREVEREIAVRERVYPKWIEAGNLSNTAGRRQLDTMRAVLVTLHEAAQLRREQAQEHRRGMSHAAAIVASAGQHEAAATINQAVQSAMRIEAATAASPGDRV